jgi:DNA-binding MarR family transcriptional regulator
VLGRSLARRTEARAEAERCAAEVLEVLPLGTRWLRSRIRSRQPSWSLPQLHTLGFLQRNPGASLSDLAGHLGVGLPTASTLVSRLVILGQLHRREDPAQRRRTTLSLTPAGQAELEAAASAAREELAERLGRLPPGQLANLTAALAQLRTVFDDGQR